MITSGYDQDAARLVKVIMFVFTLCIILACIALQLKPIVAGL